MQKTTLNSLFRFINYYRKIQIMEDQKMLKSLNEASNSKFLTRKWNISNDQRYRKYCGKNETIYNT